MLNLCMGQWVYVWFARYRNREREREGGWGGREGGVVKKVPMTHLKTVSAGNDTSTNIRESKRPGKRSGRLAERPNKRSIANNQNGYETADNP